MNELSDRFQELQGVLSASPMLAIALTLGAFSLETGSSGY